MTLLEVFLFVVSNQTTEPPKPGILALLVQMIPMLMMIFFVFWVMVIKPEQRKQKSQDDMLAALKKGDQVITSGGIIGKVAGVESDHILLEIAQNVKVKFQRRNVSSLLVKPAAQATAKEALPNKEVAAKE